MITGTQRTANAIVHKMRPRIEHKIRMFARREIYKRDAAQLKRMREQQRAFWLRTYPDQNPNRITYPGGLFMAPETKGRLVPTTIDERPDAQRVKGATSAALTLASVLS